MDLLWNAMRPPRRSIVELMRDGVLDPQLAGLLWLLVEARIPLIVAAGPRQVGKTTVLEALLDFLPAGTVRQTVAGSFEDFEWLPEAAELGWHSDRSAASSDSRAVDESNQQPSSTTPRLEPSRTVLIVPELSSHTPIYAWDETARIAVRAIAVGYGFAATIHANTLEQVFAALGGPPNDLTDDELSLLGVVVILRRLPDDRRRITAVHYVRPVARDAGGHVQRLGPAVLATWDERSDTFEGFAWGVMPEIGVRLGRQAGDLESDVARRAEYLGGLAAAGLDGVDAVRTAIDGFRQASHRPQA